MLNLRGFRFYVYMWVYLCIYEYNIWRSMLNPRKYRCIYVYVNFSVCVCKPVNYVESREIPLCIYLCVYTNVINVGVFIQACLARRMKTEDSCGIWRPQTNRLSSCYPGSRPGWLLNMRLGVDWAETAVVSSRRFASPWDETRIRCLEVIPHYTL